MNMSDRIKEVVKKTYTEAVTKNSGCCCSSTPAIETNFSESYSDVQGYNQEADYGLGCGIPTEYANIKEGDTVLDLGSGAGNDVFVARAIVGGKGRVIGVDMTEAMIAQANVNKAKLGFENVEFVLGEIEELPVEDSSVDVVVSNCVMNLVPNKVKAYQEVSRVLKAGGHFSISDMVLQGELPDSIRNAAAMYAGCVSGALSKEGYLKAIADAGFTNTRVAKEREINLPDNLLLQFISKDELEAYRKSQSAIVSITVYADKSAG
ncbi:MAG: arsenite methyltransferase [Bacteroidetes bacterium]|nr:arsenite methyltransferase [Bacteroidota bacterium]